MSYLPQSDLSAGSGTDSIRLHNCKLSQIIRVFLCVLHLVIIYALFIITYNVMCVLRSQIS